MPSGIYQRKKDWKKKHPWSNKRVLNKKEREGIKKEKNEIRFGKLQ